MTRRFAAGDVVKLGGIDLRVVSGKKVSRVAGADDLRLDIRAASWVPVPMSLGFYLADFFHENEEVLYPRELGYSGGSRYVHFINGAIVLGYETATDQLTFERQAHRARAA